MKYVTKRPNNQQIKDFMDWLKRNDMEIIHAVDGGFEKARTPEDVIEIYEENNTP